MRYVQRGSVVRLELAPILKSLIVAFTLAAPPTLAPAQTLPGADDPALREAALDFLADEDIVDAMARIGQTGMDGNIAAQLLANRIYRISVYDFPNASRENRFRLFLGDNLDDTSRFTPFRVDRSELEVFQALDHLQNLGSPEEWTQAASVASAAGYRSRVLSAPNQSSSGKCPTRTNNPDR